MEVVGAAAGIAGLLTLVYQTVDGIIKLKSFFGEVSRGQKTVFEFVHDVECLNRTLEDVKSLLSRQDIIAKGNVSVATLEAYLMECSNDIEEWIKIAAKIDPASKKGAEAFFKRFRVAVNKQGIWDLGRKVTNHQQRIGTSLSLLGRSLDILTLEGVSDASSTIDRMAKFQLDSSSTWAAKLDLIEQKIEPVSKSCSIKLDQIETSSRVSMENSVHSAISLDSVSSMVSQIYSTVSKWDSVISSKVELGDRAANSKSATSSAVANIESGDSAVNSKNVTKSAVAVTEKKKDAVAGNSMYRCCHLHCYPREKLWSDFDSFRAHVTDVHRSAGEELAFLERLAPKDVQVWSCNASLGIEDAFDRDCCGYCNEEFQANPPDWSARGRHLVTKHNFGRCSINLEQYSSLDFGEHLRHIHHAKTDTFTSTVFLRNFFTGERTFGVFSEGSSQSASTYDDLPEEPAEVAALFQAQLELLFEEFRQIQCSDKNSTIFLQNDEFVNLQEDVLSRLQDLQISAARTQEQFIVDGHSFDALNMSWDLCSCVRAQDLFGSFNPPSEIDRMNLIDDIAGKDLLGKWEDSRDRINRWLLHFLRLSKTVSTLIRGALGTYNLEESNENNWIRSVLEQWSSDEAATNHEWSIMLTDGAVDSHDDQYITFRTSTQLLEILPVPNAIGSSLFKPEVPGFPYSPLKYLILKKFIKTSGLCNSAVEPLQTSHLDNLMIRQQREKEPQKRKPEKQRFRCAFDRCDGTFKSLTACALHESYHQPDSWQYSILKSKYEKKHIEYDQGAFWCGFCQATIKTNKKGDEAENERFDYIFERFEHIFEHTVRDTYGREIESIDDRVEEREPRKLRFRCEFDKCAGTFKSEMARLLHETYHRPDSWRCERRHYGSPSCAMTFYRRDQFRAHLRKEHKILEDEELASETQRYGIGYSQGDFWCGSCRAIIKPEKPGRGAENERFDYIFERYLARFEVYVKQRIRVR